MRYAVITLLLCLLAALAIQAQTPSVVNYQGRLTDNSPDQNPVDANLPMEFHIYDVSAGGAPLWSEVWAGVDVVDGIFSVLLGSNGSPLGSSVFTGGSSRYLEVIVNGETLSPRQQIGAVGYADQAANADSSENVACTGCVSSADIADSTITGTDIAANTIGTADIATDGVGASEIAANAVGASEIASNAVGNSELSNLAAFDFSGQITFNYTSNPKFFSETSGNRRLEWWSDSGRSYLYNRPTGTYFLVNDTTGNWGIGTTAPNRRFTVVGDARVSSTFEVDGLLQADSGVQVLQNVDVAGSVFMGWERVTAQGQTSGTSTTCFQGGSWTCYTGSATATCSGGKTIIGGGCACSGVTDSTCYGYPNSNSSYFCTNAEDSPNQSFTAYAICARIGN
jgi:hypothetical protein